MLPQPVSAFFQLNGIITKDIYNSAFTIILQLREICLGRPNLGAIAFKFVVVSAFSSVSPKDLFWWQNTDTKLTWVDCTQRFAVLPMTGVRGSLSDEGMAGMWRNVISWTVGCVTNTGAIPPSQSSPTRYNQHSSWSKQLSSSADVTI